MTEENEKRLRETYLHTFMPSVNYGFDHFGFECGDGWIEIIEAAAKELEPLIKKQREEFPDEELVPRTSQLKEKFGTMRWYVDGYSEEMYKIIEECEKKSCTTCENCGKMGKIRSLNWIRTLCDDCFNAGNDKCL